MREYNKGDYDANRSHFDDGSDEGEPTDPFVDASGAKMYFSPPGEAGNYPDDDREIDPNIVSKGELSDVAPDDDIEEGKEGTATIAA